LLLRLHERINMTETCHATQHFIIQTVGHVQNMYQWVENTSFPGNASVPQLQFDTAFVSCSLREIWRWTLLAQHKRLNMD